MLTLLENLLNIYLETALWLLLGLSLAAVIKGWIPESLVTRFLSGKGPGPVIRAALIGAPLPLCSCGVLPTAVGLHRSGASRPATTSFLIATPETGVDSISVTYALMGPVMAIIRPVSAITSAIVSGLLVLVFDRKEVVDDTNNSADPSTAPTTATSCCSTKAAEPEPVSSCCSSKSPAPEAEKPASSCCSSKDTERQAAASVSACATAPAESAPETSSCCASKKTEAVVAEEKAESSCCSQKSEPEASKPGIWAGLRFALVDVLDDIKYWMAFGLVLAAIIASLVEPGNLAEYGSGLGAMLIMLVVGLPLYICASASTPLAAALLMAGLSPGTVLVFLLVGPATNIASLGILIKELGRRAVVLYLAGISISAITLGLLVDAVFGEAAVDLSGAMGAHQHPTDFSLVHWAAAIILLMLTITPLRRRFGF